MTRKDFIEKVLGIVDEELHVYGDSSNGTAHIEGYVGFSKRIAELYDLLQK